MSDDKKVVRDFYEPQLFHDHFQNFKSYNIPRAQLVIADVPYNLGKNAYASNPAWYMLRSFQPTFNEALRFASIRRAAPRSFERRRSEMMGLGLRTYADRIEATWKPEATLERGKNQNEKPE